jgi:hypothetical protein
MLQNSDFYPLFTLVDLGSISVGLRARYQKGKITQFGVWAFCQTIVIFFNNGGTNPRQILVLVSTPSGLP